MKAANQAQQAMHKTTVINGIEIDTLKATIGAIQNEPDLGACHFRATNKWLSGNHNRSTVTGFYGAKQEIAHAAVRGIKVDELESEFEGDIDLRGFLGLADDVPKGYTAIRATFRVKADPADIETLRKLATFSPVFNTLTNGTDVDVKVELKQR